MWGFYKPRDARSRATKRADEGVCQHIRDGDALEDMMVPTNINCIIFDFDGTLCFGRYFELLGEESLDAIGTLVFGNNSALWAERWMKGDLTSRDVASYLSEHLAVSEEDILSALKQGCSNMTFNPAVYDFALQQHGTERKTALVTANMDVFTEIVVPAHGLDDVFDIVLNTSDYRTLDKSILWRKALEVFGPKFSFATSLLIDNSPAMISLFESLGGHGYQYENDPAFLAWLEI
ncbi:MAG: HAD family hydrolase [Deltaproteobacteria bacterium]|nr:HAD family hydrolase [Deltaproteobacteria bacterium]